MPISLNSKLAKIEVTDPLFLTGGCSGFRSVGVKSGLILFQQGWRDVLGCGMGEFLPGWSGFIRRGDERVSDHGAEVEMKSLKNLHLPPIAGKLVKKYQY